MNIFTFYYDRGVSPVLCIFTLRLRPAIFRWLTIVKCTLVSTCQVSLSTGSLRSFRVVQCCAVFASPLSTFSFMRNDHKTETPCSRRVTFSLSPDSAR